MEPTKQTVLHDPDNGKHGNCLSAVLASLLHVPIASVPVFKAKHPQWQRDLNAWLRPFGLAYLQIGTFDEWCAEVGITGCYHEAAGPTLRSSDVLHACVGTDGSVVFDPHPDDTGLTEVQSSGVFIALEPWKNSQRIADLERELSEQARLHGMGSEREAALMAKVERLQATVEKERAATDAAVAQIAAEQATIQQMRDDFLTLARMAEDLKRDCGMDPESPQAIRNAQYMNLSYLARRNLALPADRTALDAMLAEAEKRGMLKAAEIAEECDQEYEPYVGTPRPLNYTCADAIRQAAERSGE